jgi:hypothetical protein
MSKNQNAFETTLTSQFGPSDLTAHVDTLGTLTSPCYMVFEPTSDAQREVVYFDGVFGVSSFVTTVGSNRYLAGSAASSGLTHPAGTTVRSVILSQHLDDLDTRITTLDHSDLVGLTVGDDHTQYLLKGDHLGAGFHDALGINADRLDGQHASEFAPSSHVGAGGNAHPAAVSNGDAGFMTGQDKAVLDALESAGGGVSAINPGTGIDVTGTGVVTVSHEDTSTAAGIDNGVAETVDVLSIDGMGHVTALSKKTMTPANIGAATSGHLHTGVYADAAHTTSADHDTRYYQKTTVDNLLNTKAPIASPDFTGDIDLGSTNPAKIVADGTWVKLQRNGQDVISSNAASLYLLGIGVNAGAQFEVRCSDTGSNGRQMFMRDDSSTERNKTDIVVTEKVGGECLRWDMYEFTRKGLAANGKTELWTIAERIQETSGDQYIVRDSDGLVANTDDRAMMADVILTLQTAVARIDELEKRIEVLEA